MKNAIVPAAIVAALGLSQQVNAVEFDGFLSAGFAKHNIEGATYLDSITNDIRFDNDSKFGLQITADVAQNMQAVAQVLASGSDENFDMDVEWAYVDWQIAKNISLRGGKVKEPVFLISDYFEVGYAYPWIRPPQEVYRNNPINTINGLQALIQAELGGMSLNFLPYIGSNSESVPSTNDGLRFDATNFFGGAIQLMSRSFTFQVSSLKTDVTTVDVSNSGAFAGFQDTGTAQLMSVGLSWDIANFVGYSEFVSRDIEENNLPAIFPDQDASYITLGYRMGNYLPHLTFATSEAEPSNTNPAFANQGVSQSSVTLGLRYEINDSAALKLEVQSIRPDTAENSGGLFGQNTPAAGGGPALPADWVDDDNVTLISAAVDIIF